MASFLGENEFFLLWPFFHAQCTFLKRIPEWRKMATLQLHCCVDVAKLSNSGTTWLKCRRMPTSHIPLFSLKGLRGLFLTLPDPRIALGAENCLSLKVASMWTASQVWKKTKNKRNYKVCFKSERSTEVKVKISDWMQLSAFNHWRESSAFRLTQGTAKGKFISVAWIFYFFFNIGNKIIAFLKLEGCFGVTKAVLFFCFF